MNLLSPIAKENRLQQILIISRIAAPDIGISKYFVRSYNFIIFLFKIINTVISNVNLKISGYVFKINIDRVPTIPLEYEPWKIYQ